MLLPSFIAVVLALVGIGYWILHKAQKAVVAPVAESTWPPKNLINEYEIMHIPSDTTADMFAVHMLKDGKKVPIKFVWNNGYGNQMEEDFRSHRDAQNAVVSHNAKMIEKRDIELRNATLPKSVEKLGKADA